MKYQKMSFYIVKFSVNKLILLELAINKYVVLLINVKIDLGFKDGHINDQIYCQITIWKILSVKVPKPAIN